MYRKFAFFIKNGIINDPKYFFIMIINGEKISVNIPTYNNIRILNRQNRYHIGGDFRGWSQALESLGRKILSIIFS